MEEAKRNGLLLRADGQPQPQRQVEEVEGTHGLATSLPPSQST